MNIEWSSDFALGIPIIDEQHQRLIDIINRLEIAHRENKCNETIEKLFLDLINYCNYHFTIEEQAMEKSYYDRRELHKSNHDIFINKIHGFYCKHKKEDCHALSSTIDFLSEWLIDHIMVEDRNYVSVIGEDLKKRKSPFKENKTS